MSRARVLAVAALCAGLLPIPAHADSTRAAKARKAILALDFGAAEKLLEVASDEPVLALERGRLALYRADCDGAVAFVQRPDLEETEAGAELLAVSLGCQRGTAATLMVRDEQRGVVVRLQDDEDRALVFLIADAATRTRDALERDLGVRLPSPITVELTLSALTGLPEKAAQTTGTVGVAKWGRVIMLSPRAMPHGYGWLDTLAHELTHLAMSQATLDRAPLWLQEGVAKREETRWRERDPFDELMPPDAVAAVGMSRGLGRSLTELGPSIAMLPTPDEAMVAFAEVASFVRFWAEQVGPEGLPKLIAAIREAEPGTDIDPHLIQISGMGLAAWDARWREHLSRASTELPPDLAPGGRIPHGAAIGRRLRLGELLLERGHAEAAGRELGRAQALASYIAPVRVGLALAKLGVGDRPRAATFVASPKDVHQRDGRWWSLHAELVPGADALSRWRALGLSPLDPAVACEERPAPVLPADELRRALCEAARRAPR
jgi:hypothetical protein